jgi:predicted AlkP superfamily pyrophosphatase or phosphodiesterase
VRLIVLVVVDQMIPEQLERLAPWWSGGFGRFAAGEVWRRAAHGHASTATGPGHATLGTGTHPATNGIVGNGWIDRTSGWEVYCAADASVAPLTSDGAGEPGDAGRSPANLLVDGFAAHVKAAAPGARCVGVSGKDRAATLTTGPGADWAFWWDRSSAGFASSTYYGEALPDWVVDWNDGWPEGLDAYTWEDDLPEDIGASGVAPDRRTGEVGAFPHPAPRLSSPPTAAELSGLARFVYGSPLVDRFTLELAAQAVENLELGADDEVDFLFVGLSACDTVGHSFGPYSREVTDLLLRTDAWLGELFELLDASVGEDRWIAALSSDHGVLELPESLAARGFDARRVSRAAIAQVAADLEEELVALFGSDLGLRMSSGVHFDREAIASAGVEPAEVYAIAREFLRAIDFVHSTYTFDELVAWRAADARADGLLSVVARSFHPLRSPDIALVLAPHALMSPGGTSHGSPWSYDRDVPVVFLGPGTTPGARFEPCLTVDVLPTLLARAGLAVPDGLDGRILE